MVSRAHPWLATLIALALVPAAATAGETVASVVTTASFANPHTLDLELDHRAARRSRAPNNLESIGLLDPAPGLRPLRWPRNSDLRARLLTPELKRAPLVGWIATNLYRSRNENGWCLEVDPGEGEYLVFYRRHL